MIIMLISSDKKNPLLYKCHRLKMDTANNYGSDGFMILNTDHLTPVLIVFWKFSSFILIMWYHI